MPGQQDKNSSHAPYDEKASHTTGGASHPNILLLLADQMRYDAVGAAGFPHMYTPNLDRLAAGGRLYSRGFTPIPDGMPARHNILTGLTGKTHGYTERNKGHSMPNWIDTFPKLLSDQGYETFAVGTNRFRPARRHHGYDRMQLMEARPDYREQDDYALYLQSRGWGHAARIHGCGSLLRHVPQQAFLPEEHMGDSWVAHKTVAFLRANRGRRPWLLKAGWLTPHPPLAPASRFADLYNDAELPEPIKSETPLSPPARENARLLAEQPAALRRRYRELYYGAVSQLDYNIGRILDALEETGQAENTLVIFTSDHGDMLGDQGALEKGLPYDSCTRIPLILRFPGRIEPGERADHFADLNDIFPTVTDAAGIRISYKNTPFPGESLLLPEEERKKDRSAQYVEYSAGLRRWVSLRTETHKYNYYYNGGYEELFDLTADPGESRNLLAPEGTLPGEDPAALRETLRKRLIAWERERGPEGCLLEEEFVTLPEAPALSKKTFAFPRFPREIMDERERSRMNSPAEEILRLIEKEPSVRLEELDLEGWRQTEELTEKQLKELLEREAKMRQRQQQGREE